jgi:hypothetical protein
MAQPVPQFKLQELGKSALRTEPKFLPREMDPFSFKSNGGSIDILEDDRLLSIRHLIAESGTRKAEPPCSPF